MRHLQEYMEKKLEEKLGRTRYIGSIAGIAPVMMNDQVYAMVGYRISLVDMKERILASPSSSVALNVMIDYLAFIHSYEDDTVGVSLDVMDDPVQVTLNIASVSAKSLFMGYLFAGTMAQETVRTGSKDEAIETVADFLESLNKLQDMLIDQNLSDAVRDEAWFKERLQRFFDMVNNGRWQPDEMVEDGEGKIAVCWLSDDVDMDSDPGVGV